MGAPESGAGDDYHLWWAATKALRLIAPGTDLKLVTLEGLSRVDGEDDTSQVVDLAEYYCGDDLASAAVVVVSQLKHSTKHPQKAWTVSRLCKTKTRRNTSGKTVSHRSLAADLAEMYARFVKAGHQRDMLLHKLQIRLVSNQPADPDLLEAVAAAARQVRNADGPARRDALLRALSPPHADVISKITDAVGGRLPSEQFCDFLAVLDLSQTGALDRSALARQVRSETATLTPGSARSSTLELYDLVHKQALPSPATRGIRRHDVLAALGVATEEDLYPAPSALPDVPNPLPAPGGQVIAEEVIGHMGQLMVAHGGAGVGKTTALQQIDDHLPAESIVVIFDCYGGGQYLSTGEERHTTRRFAVQVINELAQLCGIPLLVEPPPVEDDLWRRLRRTLEQAAETLEGDAVLVIAVDAADNAVTAADRRNQPSFLSGLVDLTPPERVSVVLTARSHRLESLGAGDAPKVEIEPFDENTSVQHLRRYRPDPSGELLEKFHERTGGNPRVQFYVLSAGEKEGWDDEKLLDECVKTPEPLFEGLMRSGLEVSPTGAGGQQWLSLLVALGRPINIHTFARAVEVDADAVRRFAKGLSPGVALADDTVEFRDEDFERYVRDQVTKEELKAAHSKLATLLKSMASTDADAAAHVAEHLFHAGRHDELVQLVLDEPVPISIPDGLRRSEVQGKRLDLAASVLATKGNPSDAVRFAIRTTQASVRHDALSSLADTNLELVARHVDLDLLKSNLMRPSYQESLAPHWMLLAAVLSRNQGQLSDAKDALDHADSWLRRLIERSEAGEEDVFRGIRDDHVAAAAEARYRLFGFADALREVGRWGPVSFACKVAARLGQRIRGEVVTGTLQKELDALGVPPARQVALLTYASKLDQPPSKGWLKATVGALVTEEDVDREAEWWLPYAQIVTRHASRDVATKLLQHLRRELPMRWTAYNHGAQEGTIELRLRALNSAVRGEELTADSLGPPELRTPEEKGENDPRASDRRAWQEAVNPLLPAAIVEARAVVGVADAGDVAELVETALTQRLDQADHRWFRFDKTFRPWAAIAVDAAVTAEASQEVLEQVRDAAPRLLGSGAVSLWLEIAAQLMRRSAHTGYVADLCRQASLQIPSADLSARERLELLAQAAEIADSVEPELGRQLFDEAVETASSINDEAARSLDIYADLAHKIPLDQAPPGLAGKLVAAAEAVAPHVTEDGFVPYRGTLRAAARLDLDISFAAASRWDDEDRIGLYATVPAAALGGVESQALTVREALALAHLVDRDDARLRFQLTVLEQSAAGIERRRVIREGTSRAVSWLRKHVAARNQPGLARQLLEWAEQHDADGPVRAELESVTRFPDMSESHTSWRPGQIDHNTEELLKGAEARTWRSLGEDAAGLRSAHVWGDRLGGFVDDVIDNTPPSERLDALTAVAELDIEPDVMVRVLARRLKEWRRWPGVEAWAQQQLPKLLKRHLHRLVLEHDSTRLLEQLRHFSDDDEIRAAVLDAVPTVRPHLRSYATVNLASLLSHLCPPEEAAQAVVPLLDELLDAADVTFTPIAPGSKDMPLARLLWSVFGHPSRVMRWRAAHTTRELLTQLPKPEAQQLAAALVSHLDETSPGNYRSAELHFYAMSAVAALLVALQRVAHERPDILAAHVDALVAAATSTANPHVQIRELARQAALALVDDDTGVAEKLRLANRPIACSTDRSMTRETSRLEQKGRYRFDSMDTLPYWYRPLANIFGVELDTVTDHAEEWIVDRCGLGEQDWMEDVRELRDERSYDRMGHRQGIIPVEESLRLYLEYHAMMIAAGRLVDAETPMRVGSYDDEDPWGYWLSEHLPSSERGWIADLRSSTPTEGGLFEPPAAEPWPQPEDEEYDAALAITGRELPQNVRVAGVIRLAGRGGSKTTYIRSALVSPETSTSLARALSAAEEPFDWKLPNEDEEEFEVDDGPFVLRGWLTEPSDGHEGLEGHDPYAQGISLSRPLPGEKFCTATETHADRTTLNVQRPDATVVARVEQWADPGETELGLSSSGHRLQVTRNALLSYLQAARMNFIVEVQIGRYRRDPNSTYERRSKLYVVDADGNISRW